MSRSGRLAGRTGETLVRLRFGATTVEQQGERYLFHVQVFLDDIDPDAVSAELYAEAQKDEGPITQSMNRGERLVGATRGFTYSASVPTSRPVADYTPRLVPRHVLAFVPQPLPRRIRKTKNNVR